MNGRAIAYLDESEPNRQRHLGAYILAAAIVPVDEQAAARASMVALKPRSLSKAHWHQQPDPKQRRQLATAVGAIPGSQLVVVRLGATDLRPERRRRLCLEWMTYELGQLGVQDAVIESRGPADDARDLAMLQALRQRHALAGPLRFEHVPGPVEPLLWAADVVCGAVNEARADNPTYVELLPALRTVLVDDR